MINSCNSQDAVIHYVGGINVVSGADVNGGNKKIKKISTKSQDTPTS
jgi:hypothetical protein